MNDTYPADNTYSYSKKGDFLSILTNYYSLPSKRLLELFEVLEAASEYAIEIVGYNNIDIKIKKGDGGSTEGANSNEYTITIPESTGGFITFGNSTNNTFIQYEGRVTLVHELGHVILGLLGNEESPDEKLRPCR